MFKKGMVVESEMMLKGEEKSKGFQKKMEICPKWVSFFSTADLYRINLHS